jgi:hypothetical protein
MNKILAQIPAIIFFIFAAIGFAVFLYFVDKKLKLGWLFPWVIIGAPLLWLVFNLILRDIRSRGWHQPPPK